MVYEIQTIDILNQLGANKKYKGYTYIISSILYINERSEMPVLTKMLYVDIAKKYNTSAQCVEKNIRKVIENIWENKHNEPLKKSIFGEYQNTRPSNSEFLLSLHQYASTHATREISKEEYSFVCPASGTDCEFCSQLIHEIFSKFIR
ncbi:MAG: hypothetical protein E7260_08975 [Lachnospiraceae bacterium]|nr:hypothetical protein [Lachnospiraceae bacterium]